MSERQRAALAFGRGLDRGSGGLVAEDASFLDLRNVHLAVGRATARRGLSLWVNLAGEGAIIHVHPIRSQNVGVAITYNPATRQVNLYRITLADTSRSSFVGTLWTLPVGASFPRVHAADSYGKLYIAHDEPEYAGGRRMQTRIYDPGAGTLTDLASDFYAPTEPPTPVPVHYRGVVRYLNYLFAWGYGTEADPDRQDVVRTSLPGRPESFDPQHLFYAGQRGEPVEAVIPASGTLLVFKQTETYEIHGTDRASFGIRLLDPLFGAIVGKLAINVGGAVYFWSAEGPRVTTGQGASVDLALPLDLGGPSPDALADAGALQYGFAAYLPERREVLFVFGRWAYALHLKNLNDPRWSYRQFAVDLACAGPIYSAEISTYVNPDPPPEEPTPPAPIETTTSRPSPLTASYSALAGTVGYTTTGTLQTGTTYELYRRVAGTSGWSLRGSGTVLSGTNTVGDTAAAYATTYEYAMRFTHGGTFEAAYASSDPGTWPSDSRASATTGAEPGPPPAGSVIPAVTDLAVLRAVNSVELSWSMPAGAPVGTLWAVYQASSAGGPWFANGVETTDTVVDFATTTGLHYWKIIGSYTGWTDSDDSNVVSASGSSGGGGGGGGTL